MRFDYEYRTSDNVQHRGSLSAPDREAVFSMLKAKGIKPGRVIEAPGFFNKLFGKGKRWMAIVGLLLLVVALAISLMRRDGGRIAANAWDDTTRHWPIGDVAEINRGIKTSWADVFESEGDRFLAAFAIPGEPVAKRTIDEKELVRVLDVPCSVAPDDTIEVRQIKSIVIGLKDELRQYIQDGGTVRSYCGRLMERQQQEVGYYQRGARELERMRSEKRPEAEIIAAWKACNERMKAIGIKSVPWPE